MASSDCENTEISSNSDGCVLRGILQYDGTGFAGWQNQRQGERTVQGVLEAALSQIASRPISVQGAGRTDSGVHALGQVFSCAWPTPTPPERLRHALSRMLTPEIRVSELALAPAHFSARFSARGKRYAYTLDFARAPHPLLARYAWSVHHDVDLDAVRRMLASIVGTHDFAGFQSAGSQMKTTVRTIHEAKLLHGGTIGLADCPELWRIEYYGDAFLYRMVRNLTGTMIEVARGRFPESFFHELLHSPGPFLGHCAPAHGLVLVKVDYDPADIAVPAA